MFSVNVLQPEIDYRTGRVIARHEVIEGNYREWYDVCQKDRVYDMEVRRHRSKRSLDANAYYHVLVNKIARALGSSMQEVKETTLHRYGQLKLVDGKPVEVLLPDAMPVRDDIHLWPTTEIVYTRGELYRWYRVIRGSHTYDTAEMSRLIEGTISDAKDAGLTSAEIMTPNERRQLTDVYGVRI